MACSRFIAVAAAVAAVGVLCGAGGWAQSRGAYNSVITQSFHYFSRPHTHIRERPMLVRAAWRGVDLAARPGEWQTVLTPAQVGEVRRVVAAAEATGKPMGQLGAGDCPFESLVPAIARWRRELAGPEGLGFHVTRGVPVESWTPKQRAVFFWCLGQHLGVPGAQDNDGKLLGDVRDTGADPATERQYKTHALIRPHCDAADVVGLMCVHTAKSGGTSRLVSSVSVYNRLLARGNWSHIEQLYQPLPLDTRGSGGVNYVRIPPLRYSHSFLRTFWHSEYYRTAYRHPDAPAPPPNQAPNTVPAAVEEALAAYDSIVNDPELGLEMELRPGDIQLASNHVVVHSRTAYEDGDTEETTRHLLRLWISLDEPLTATEWRLKQLERLRLAGRFAWGKMRRLLWRG